MGMRHQWRGSMSKVRRTFNTFFVLVFLLVCAPDAPFTHFLPSAGAANATSDEECEEDPKCEVVRMVAKRETCEGTWHYHVARLGRHFRSDRRLGG